MTTSQCPSDHRAHNMWGLSYRLLVDHVSGEAAAAALRASAIRRYMSAIALHPEFPEVASLVLLPLHSRASMDNRLRRTAYIDTVCVCVRLVTCGQALTNLGNVLCDVGQVVQGCVCYMHALLVAPRFANAYQALARRVSTSDSNGPTGFPQMRRLIMEVWGGVLRQYGVELTHTALFTLPSPTPPHTQQSEGRTAHVPDELFLCVALLLLLQPRAFEATGIDQRQHRAVLMGFKLPTGVCSVCERATPHITSTSSHMTVSPHSHTQREHELSMLALPALSRLRFELWPESGHMSRHSALHCSSWRGCTR